jgi:hypothetical protein
MTCSGSLPLLTALVRFPVAAWSWALAELVDQVPVVAVEGGVRDAQGPLDSGHGGLAAGFGGLGEDTGHNGVDLVIGGQGPSHACSGCGWRCLSRKAVCSLSCSSIRWRT